MIYILLYKQIIHFFFIKNQIYQKIIINIYFRLNDLQINKFQIKINFSANNKKWIYSQFCSLYQQYFLYINIQFSKKFKYVIYYYQNIDLITKIHILALFCLEKINQKCQPQVLININTYQKEIKNYSDIIIIFNEKEQSYIEYQNQNQNQNYDLSIVIPAYNEQNRIGKMLTQTINYFEEQYTQKNKNYEIIVVDDASKDKTYYFIKKNHQKIQQNSIEIVKSFFNFQGKKINLKIISYKKNIGKGGAVRYGILLAKGKYRLFADADGATKIDDFQKLYDKIQQIEINNLGISVGSRSHMYQDTQLERKWYRLVLSLISKIIVQQICGVKLNDTQCGFKLFTQKTALKIFQTQHLERWAFDVELFMIANYYKVPIVEVPVNWKDVDGSHLNIIDASVTMLRDFLMVRLLYLSQVWQYTDLTFKYS
ncbi:hypothetical protein IMG5_196190 [Ichthyophthirius multifiliis]|uniref:dolichyl-phosphate beta-glucosyltransferase n=1 Tax=Ichthyophthirius multifiliis TaxID=5932 RepID=G0R534_ICHMU|nr:hypothetical protein IMG5_196190 [Ichthyophthirius multifiliis]EGR27436.1 hypothetical protein IMG5_196190 [Ichthyophthirius multifiliis]|eukprot:XP_004024346.1 hypothetical protein IMG5_196190 [Ichthyophthirius multifiliis]